MVKQISLVLCFNQQKNNELSNEMPGSHLASGHLLYKDLIYVEYSTRC